MDGSANEAGRRWRVWVDTGGTFTDGLAVAPDGAWKRCKILSTSALRGTVRKRLAPDRFEIDEAWSAPPALIESLRFRLLGGQDLYPVRRYDAAERILELDGTIDRDLDTPAAFEVVSDEESPVFAARLLTGTPRPDRCPRR